MPSSKLHRIAGAVALLLGLASAPRAFAAISWVNSAWTNSILSSSSPMTVTLAVTSGNALLVTEKFYDLTSAPTAPTDTAGNTFTLIAQASGTTAGGANYVYLFFAYNVSGNSADVINMGTYPNNYPVLVAEQYAGLSGVVDGSYVTGAAGTDSWPNSTPVTTGALTTTHANDLIYGVLTVDLNSGYLASVNSPLSLRTAPPNNTSNDNDDPQFGTADYIASSTISAETFTMTGASPASTTGNCDFTVIVIALEGSAAAAPKACTLSLLGAGPC